MRIVRVINITIILCVSAALCDTAFAQQDPKPKVTVSVSTAPLVTDPDLTQPQQQLPQQQLPQQQLPQQQLPQQQLPQQQLPQQQLPQQQLPPQRRPMIIPQNPPDQGALGQGLDRISGCTPKPELCNRKDDDCDGIIDNNIRSQSCTPTTFMQDGCFTAHTSCINGQTVCDVDSAHSVEICNDIDDDCDGIVDNHMPSQTCFIDLNQGYGRTICRHGKTYCRPNVRRPVYSDCNDGDCYVDHGNHNNDANTDTQPPEKDIEYVQGNNPAPASNSGLHEGDDCSKANFIEPGKFPIDLEGYADDITLSCGTHDSVDRFYQLSIDAGTLNVTFNEKDSDAVWAVFEGSCGNMHEVFCGTGTTPPLKSNVYYLVVEVPPNSATPRSVMNIKYTP